MLPLEDKFGDIIRKAMRGKKIQPADLARQIGLTEPQLAEMFDDRFTPPDDTIRKLAPLLSLHTGALLDSAHNRWQPRPICLDCLAQISAPYDDFIVNTFLLWDTSSKRAVLFDAGPAFPAIEQAARQHGLHVEWIALTHTHRDHIATLAEAQKTFRATTVTSPREPAPGAQPVREGDILQAGRMKIEVRETEGHSVGGLTFVVTGLEGAPAIAVVGDALFAGSMGGPMISYENLTRNIREKILSLPAEAILCPGHGPPTTVGEEKQHNPFFA